MSSGTIEEMKLELKAQGVDKFIQSLEESQLALKGVSENINKVLKDAGVLDKKIGKTEKIRADKTKKINDKDIKQKKDALKENKANFNELTKIFKIMGAISGLSFGMKGIKDGANKSANDITSLANQARTGTASAKDIEAVHQALKLGNQNAGTLDGLINKLSLNQSGYKANGNIDPDILSMITNLNAFSGSNKQVDYLDTSPIKTLREISAVLTSIKDDNRRLQVADRMGLDGAQYSALSDKNFNSNLNTGEKQAISTLAQVERSRKSKVELEKSEKELDNAINIVGEKWTGASVKLNKIYTNLATNSATLAPMVEDALDLVNVLVTGVSKGVDTLFGKDGLYTTQKKEALEYLNNIEKKQGKAEGQKGEILKRLDDNIESIDRENGVIKFKNNEGSFNGGIIDWLKYSPYIFDHLNSLLKTDSDTGLKNKTSGLIGVDNNKFSNYNELSAPNPLQSSINSVANNSNAVVNNYEIVVNSDASTFSALMADIESLKSSVDMQRSSFNKINASGVFPHLSNIS
ncbi:hypothetical protein DES39_1880 [Orbus hercynius]|uniref:Uncharacterized protein n=1 Tax=Orbus hercynius TaxID=593135 RepID=A0A495RCC8_9GAMM|nr:hypothetical protein [Orbus hercynius]RKS84668.1 hypothetical protein DES39_1880 [Orbus hercynius]